jgi:nitrosocyanin
MRMRRSIGAGLLVVAAGMGLAGCGGGGGEKKSATAKQESSSGGGTTIEAQDFKFVPNTLTAKSGEAVTVTIKNTGQAEHNFSIESLKVNKDIEKGESATVTFTPTQAGSIEFFCEYHKASKGMTGTLTVS